MIKERLWTKDFIIVSLINFLLTLVFFLLIVTIAPYAVEKFDASTSIAGLVSSIFIIGVLIGRLVTGRKIQDAGSKKVLFTGLILFIITTALYFVAVHLPLLLLNRFLHGIALGVASTATGTIIAQIIPKNRRGEGIGYYSLSSILASAIGPLVGIQLTQYGDYSMVFIFNLILSIFCLFISFTLKIPVSQSMKGNLEKAGQGFKISNFLEPMVIPISIVALVIGFCYSGVMSFLTFYTKEIQLVEAGSFFFLVYAIIIIISRPFTGRLMDLKGANIVVYPCLIIFSAGMVLFSQAHSGFVLLLAGVLIGLGYGNFNSIVQATAIKITVPHRLGLATSTYFILYDLGLGAGPYLLGFLAPIIGYRGLFLAMAMVVLLSIILYYFLYSRKEREIYQSIANRTA
ncbi:MFS transporter [Bacillus sp. DTU_2020_1000418_1_SI_GHA_SEK_038]|uniref:MFS transporter n=1 Tax=Bacillus sp. DTU_2020_1000418_1_SI_GHA_SEK_038 TaxID=3077585 RepID=UPI0028E9658F|nr:MFS transporter [Bacillus sp. DTU_2020_1000418_1_SI_GHA_SEK_038]WNS76472.1 MFS transporter [Bacillus sp. DTU_2020_1000418_1_SI_GHA_SEK_038]